MTIVWITRFDVDPAILKTGDAGMGQSLYISAQTCHDALLHGASRTKGIDR
jgi:hypothetical protein